MAKVYCEYCGSSASDVRSLVAGTCNRHPDGRGRHKLYEGGEKAKYTCKHCGTSASDIRSLTGGTCHRHPAGKGKHAPAL